MARRRHADRRLQNCNIRVLYENHVLDSTHCRPLREVINGAHHASSEPDMCSHLISGSADQQHSMSEAYAAGISGGSSGRAQQWTTPYST